MMTLVEIEQAVEKLARPQQEKLFRFLTRKVEGVSQTKRSLPLVRAIGQKITQEQIDNAVDAD